MAWPFSSIHDDYAKDFRHSMQFKTCLCIAQAFSHIQYIVTRLHTTLCLQPTVQYNRNITYSIAMEGLGRTYISHYNNVIMGPMAFQITNLAIVLLSRLFGHRWKKTSKLRVTGLCGGNSPATGEFPAQMASNVENVSMWWRHHALCTHQRPLVRIIMGSHSTQVGWLQRNVILSHQR